MLQKIISDAAGFAVSYTLPAPGAGSAVKKTAHKLITSTRVHYRVKAQEKTEAGLIEQLNTEIDALIQHLCKVEVTKKPRANSFDGSEPVIPVRVLEVQGDKVCALFDTVCNLKGAFRACQALENSKMVEALPDGDLMPYIDDKPTQRSICNIMALLGLNFTQKFEDVSSEDKGTINAKLECLREAETIIPGVVGSRTPTPSRLGSPSPAPGDCPSPGRLGSPSPAPGDCPSPVFGTCSSPVPFWSGAGRDDSKDLKENPMHKEKELKPQDNIKRTDKL